MAKMQDSVVSKMETTEHSEALKPSGVPWIGDIPEAWEVLKLKNLAELYTGNSISDGEKKNYSNSKDAIPYVSTKDINVETKSLNCDNGMFIPLEKTSFKVAPKNSTLLCIEGGSAGKKITFTNQDVCFVNKLCCFKCNNHYHPKLLYYYCQCDAFLTDFYLSLNGLIGGVTVSKIKQMLILVPPLPEQEAIARYLDDKCSLVDATVEKEKLAIAKLKEYKQAVITEAVTKGLNPHAPLKPSGIPWIGDIPEAWERTKLKRLLEIPITDGPHETPLFIDEGIPFISAEAIKNNTVNFNLKRGYISKEEHLRFTKKCKPKVHDIFMVKSGATTGNIALVETTEEFSIWSPLALMRSNKERLYYKYLFYYLQSHLFKKQVEQFWSYGTQQNIGMEVLGNLFLAYPPPPEQEAIARYLDAKCSQVEGVIAQKEAIIVKLNDYKKSLIYECVTGKKKVPTL